MAGGVPAGLRRWLLSGWLRAGFDAFMTWAAIRQASGRKSSFFHPVSFRSLSLSSPLDVLAFSCWLCLFDLGGQVDGIGAACPSGRGAGRVVLSCGMGQGWPLSCRVCWPSPLLAVLGQSVRALGLVLGMGGDLRPTGLLIGKMHKESIRNAA